MGDLKTGVLIILFAGVALFPAYADAGKRVGPGVFEHQRGKTLRTKFVSHVRAGEASQTIRGECYLGIGRWRKKPAWSTSDDLAPYMELAAGEWNSHIAKSVIGKRDPDSRNTIRREAFGEDKPVAITYLWSKERRNRRVPYAFRIILNDSFDFVDGSDPNGLDLLSVLTHEVGHAIGMGHTDCLQETMFRFISRGETKKRDLHAGDIEGLNALY